MTALSDPGNVNLGPSRVKRLRITVDLYRDGAGVVLFSTDPALPPGGIVSQLDQQAADKVRPLLG